MGSDDAKPKSLMSRNKGNSKVITGGRSIKHWPKHGWSGATQSTWFANPDPALNPPSESLSTDEPPKSKKSRFSHGARSSASKRIPTAGATAGSVPSWAFLAGSSGGTGAGRGIYHGEGGFKAGHGGDIGVGAQGRGGGTG